MQRKTWYSILGLDALPLSLKNPVVKAKVYNCHNIKMCEQIHQNQHFSGIYGLAVILSIPRLTTSTNVDEIGISQKQNTLAKLQKFSVLPGDTKPAQILNYVLHK